jgi:hypothetical protein
MIRQYQQQEAEQELEPGQAIPIPINDNRDEAATRDTTAENNGDLKKQSQFNPVLMDVTSYLKKDYDNNMTDGTEENKANLSLREQSQFDAKVPTDGAPNTEKPVASATG